jgi:hypothetical protein
VFHNGDPVNVITREAATTDLLLITTEEQDGMIDALRGFTTARDLHTAPCPILAVPTAAVG